MQLGSIYDVSVAMLLYSAVFRATVKTATATDDDDGSRFDVIVPHPEHLLLFSMGATASTK